MKSLTLSSNETIYYDYQPEADALEIRLQPDAGPTHTQPLNDFPNLAISRDAETGAVVGLHVTSVQEVILQNLVRDLFTLTRSYIEAAAAEPLPQREVVETTPVEASQVDDESPAEAAAPSEAAPRPTRASRSRSRKRAQEPQPAVIEAEVTPEGDAVAALLPPPMDTPTEEAPVAEATVVEASTAESEAAPLLVPEAAPAPEAVEAVVEEAPAKPKRASRRKKSKEPEPTESVEALAVAPPAEEAPPKPKRSRSRKKAEDTPQSTAEVEASTPVAEAPIEEAPAKPRRTSRRKKAEEPAPEPAPVEAVVEEAAPVSAELTTTEIAAEVAMPTETDGEEPSIEAESSDAPGQSRSSRRRRRRRGKGVAATSAEADLEGEETTPDGLGEAAAVAEEPEGEAEVEVDAETDAEDKAASSKRKRRRKRKRGGAREEQATETPTAAAPAPQLAAPQPSAPAAQPQPRAERDDWPHRSYKTEPIPGLEAPEAFAFMQMNPLLGQAIAAMGFEEPTAIQSRFIPEGLTGKDVIGLAQTGTGKTLAFLVPALQRLLADPTPTHRPRVLVLVPTRELAVQVSEEAEYLATHTDLRITTIYGGVDMKRQIDDLRRGPDVIVATPGRLLDHLNRNNVRLDTVQVLVLDEADRMLDMGFLPEIRTIVGRVPKERQTMLVSATMPPPIQSLSMDFQRDPVVVEVARQLPPESIQQAFYPVEKHLKTPLLIHLLQNGPDMTSVLVFTETKSDAEILRRKLQEAGLSVSAMHGDRSQREREEALQSLRKGSIRVLVATDVAARGLDISDISHVINYDMPQTVDDYVHRIGRTGRGEAQGAAYSFTTIGDQAMVMRVESALGRTLPRQQAEGFNYAVPTPSWAKPSADDIIESLNKPASLSDRFRRMMGGGRR